SHSSVERFIGPDATITLDFALARLTGVIEKLLVYPERMQKNLDRMGGLVHSQRVLLALTQAGISREDAYRLVQRNAMKVWESDGELSLLDLLKNDDEVKQAMSDSELEEKFDLEYHFKHVDTIFERVFGCHPHFTSPFIALSIAPFARQGREKQPMQILRTVVWVVVAIALLIFSIMNWDPVEVKIWEGLVLETKIPALVIVSFLLGLLPMWMLHQGTKWRLSRRINTLENAVRASAGAEAPAADSPAPAVPPAVGPATPAPAAATPPPEAPAPDPAPAEKADGTEKPSA